MEVSCQLHPPASLLLEKQSLVQGHGGPQSRFERFGEENNLLPLPDIEPRLLGRPVRSLVTMPSELL
jgi:hypothetical protein